MKKLLQILNLKNESNIIEENFNKQETRGGSRLGSGRPKEKPTKVLSYRVPLTKANKIDKEIRKIIKLCASPSSY